MVHTARKPVAMALTFSGAIAFVMLHGVGLSNKGRTLSAAAFEDQVSAEIASDDDVRTPLLVFAQSIMCGDETLSDQHINQLRSLGPSALDKLLALRKVVSDDGVQNGATLTAQLSRLDRLIDEVGGQRYCTYSRLYWYTDWQQVIEASKKTGKPILSLHMLGELTDELSCADSRIFRLALYANESVANELRTQFVLHWRSVRPLPRVTIDFGDGRQIQTTLASNSIHYVMDSEGIVLDGMPGRCSAQQFLAWLERMGNLHRASRTWPECDFAAKLAAFHQSRISSIDEGWARTRDLRPEAEANRASIIESSELPQPASVVAIPRSAATDMQYNQTVRWDVASLDESLDANTQSLLRQFEPWHGMIEQDENAAKPESAFQAAVTALGRSLSDTWGLE